MTAPAVDLRAAAAEVCAQRGFQLLCDLGRGAFKSAYLVDTPAGRAALKLAQIGLAAERLAREINALRNCAHQSIARLVDAFPHMHDGTALLVVQEEFLEGGTLEARLQAGVLPPEQVRAIGVCLAQVLEHLHERRLVHRDIKPANILFRADPNVPVLTDFGIVRVLDAPTLTMAFLGMGPGTPAFAAPEQLNNEKAQIDWRTDQYGVALVLAGCLLGTHPFVLPGGTVHDAIVAVATKRPPPADAVARLTAMGFACLVQALQPWPVQRFRKPPEFIAALQQI